MKRFFIKFIVFIICIKFEYLSLLNDLFKFYLKKKKKLRRKVRMKNILIINSNKSESGSGLENEKKNKCRVCINYKK